MSSPSLSIACDRDLLLTAIQAADAVVPSTSTKPILTNLLLDATQGGIEVIATDLQVGLRSVVRAADVKSPGQAVIQARQIGAILKESSSPAVQIELVRKGESSQVEVRLADGDYQVPAVVGDTFPPVTNFPSDAPVISVPGARFAEMVRQTVFAMDKDRSSAVLSGMHLAIGNGELVLAATDGKVLSEAVERGEAYNHGTSVVVPSVAVGHLQRILSALEPRTVDLAVAGKLFFARMGLDSGLRIELTSRLVEGAFPAYRNALPSTATGTVTFVAAELASAVRRAALMTSNTSRGLILNLDRDQAVLTNLNYTNGSARIPIACQYQGGPLKLGINSQYLQDVLHVYKGERITVELGRGLIMREAGVTFLVMPISLPT